MKVSVPIFTKTMDTEYPDEFCHLDWDKSRPWTLLFAVILSAQCTDKRVNEVTPGLFSTFPDLESYVAKPIEELEAAIKPTGFFRNKAKSLSGAAQGILLDHNGIVPDTMEELTNLRGVGRKTANVILWNLFQKNEGMVVDTHIGRISRRIGLTKEENPIKVEKDLIKKLPQEKWGPISHQMIQFGRDYCKAPTPICSTCPLKDVCPKNGVLKSK